MIEKTDREKLVKAIAYLRLSRVLLGGPAVVIGFLGLGISIFQIAHGVGLAIIQTLCVSFLFVAFGFFVLALGTATSIMARILDGLSSKE